jgi:hypothetical protein
MSRSRLRNFLNNFTLTINTYLYKNILIDGMNLDAAFSGAKRPRRLAKAGIEAMDQWLAMLRNAVMARHGQACLRAVWSVEWKQAMCG